MTIFTLPSLPEFVAKYCWTCCKAANMAALRIHCYLGYGHTDAPRVVSQKQGFYSETLRSTLGKHHWERLCQGLWFVPGRARHFCCTCEIILFQCFNRSNPWYFKLNVWNIVISQLWRMGLQGYSRWRSWRSINSAHWLALSNHTLWSRGLETRIWSL